MDFNSKRPKFCTDKNHRRRILKICHFLQNSYFFLKMSIFLSNRRIIQIFKKMTHFDNPFLRIFVSVCWDSEKIGVYLYDV